MLLVPSPRPPDPGAHDPHSRRVAHLLAEVARRGTRVKVVTPEPDTGGAGRLRSAGVEVERLAIGDRTLAAHLGGASSVLIWQLHGPLARLAADSAREAGDVPSVLLVGEVASVAAASIATGPGAHHLDGIDLFVDSLRRHERQVLASVDSIVCHDLDTAGSLRSIQPSCDPVVLEVPLVPWADLDDAWVPGFPERSGIALVGAFHTGPGLLDVAALGRLRSAMAGRPRLCRSARPASLVGLDGPAWPIALSAELSASEPTWDEARRSARAVVVARTAGATATLIVDDLLASSTPFAVDAGAVGSTAARRLGNALDLVTAQGPDGSMALAEELLCDRTLWSEVHAALRSAAEATSALSDPVSVLTDLLALDPAATGSQERTNRPDPATPLGGGSDEGDPTDEGESLDWLYDAQGAVALERTPGSLAAADPAAALLERRWGLGWSIDRDLAMKMQRLLGPDATYRLWRSIHEEHPAELAALAGRSTPGGHRPNFSVLVPCWRTPPDLLERCVGSVTAQAWPHWQLVLVDDGSQDPDLSAALRRLAEADERITVVELEASRGIVGATNAALEVATGEWLALLDHDDELHPAALWRMAERIDAGPGVDAIYSDEDKIDVEGVRRDPTFKPDHAPDLLDGVNVANHLTVVRTSIVRELGGWREGLDGAQDHDLWLRLSGHTDRIAHVARPLYHWRQVPGSTAEVADAKPRAGESGERAIRDALERRGEVAEVEAGVLPTWHRVRRPVDKDVLVSVLIPLRDRPELLERCVEMIDDTVEHPSLELVLIDNDSRDPATLSLLDRLHGEGATVVTYPHEFNFARQMNLGALAASGSVLTFLNNDVVAETPGWFEEMLGQVLRPEVGLVGARMHTPTGYTQHEGIVLGVGGVAWNLRAGHHGLWNENVRDTAGATAAAAMVRADVFAAVGGFDDQLRVANNDVDLGIRIGARGWRNLYTPWARLVHEESASRGPLHPIEDEARFVGRWGPAGTLRDPFWNVNQDIPEIDLLAT